MGVETGWDDILFILWLRVWLTLKAPWTCFLTGSLHNKNRNLKLWKRDSTKKKGKEKQKETKIDFQLTNYQNEPGSSCKIKEIWEVLVMISVRI